MIRTQTNSGYPGRLSLTVVAVFAIVAGTNSGYSAPLDVFWEKSDADFTSVTLNDVAVTPDGAFLLGGCVTSPTLKYSQHGEHRRFACVMKVEGTGNGKKVWEKRFRRDDYAGSSIPFSEIVSLSGTPDGGCVYLEHFEVADLFNPLSRTIMNFVGMLDSHGEPEWETAFHGVDSFAPDAILLQEVVQGNNGDYGLAGYLSGVAESCFIRLDGKTGQVLCRKPLGSYSMMNRAMAASPDGGFFIAEQKDLGQSVEVHVVKVNPLGDILWQATLGYPEYVWSIPGAVRGTNDGGCVVAGGTSVLSVSQGYLAKLDVTGKVEWQKAWGGSATAWLGFGSVDILAGGDFLCAGQLSQLAGNGISVSSSVYLSRTDSSGNLRWEKPFAFSQSFTRPLRAFVIPGGAYGFLGLRGPTPNAIAMTPFLVKISSEARAEVWARYGSATIASPAATGFLTGCEVSSLRGTEFEEPGRIMPR